MADAAGHPRPAWPGQACEPAHTVAALPRRKTPWNPGRMNIARATLPTPPRAQPLACGFFLLVGLTMACRPAAGPGVPAVEFAPVALGFAATSDRHTSRVHVDGVLTVAPAGHQESALRFLPRRL